MCLHLSGSRAVCNGMPLFAFSGEMEDWLSEGAWEMDGCANAVELLTVFVLLIIACWSLVGRELAA